MRSSAQTPDEYLAALPAERRATLEQVRRLILDNLDADYEEGMQYGMIGYYVPHRVYPAGYHCDPRQPLPFAGLAAQKNHLAIYLMCLYGDSPACQHFQRDWAKTGKKLDMGKCCIRFRKADDLALDVLARLIRQTTVKKYLKHYEAARSAPRARPAEQAAKSRPVKTSPQPASGKAAAKTSRSTTSKPAAPTGRRPPG